ncbi:MFS general substrate transporter [Sistotremastrum niveocremeum HHB9708]|uniref:MFS general substrate transporter n=1 Tax=Sistotremastrum niveocremeum HHB9708 TaxID=1314777 RepID=A0A164MSX5_9AGAM|nr:MFS general substrate transporter [Sistotremastrum niveocremeum HHB9708]
MMSEPVVEKSHMDSEKGSVSQSEDVSRSSGEEIDFDKYQSQMAGRLVVDPEEAKIEFGEAVASKLKLSRDGHKVLWPQPTDLREDPQNWSDRRKNILLLISVLAAIVPDFDSGIGIASIFALATQYNTTPNAINNITSNWSIFLLGPGGVFAIILVKRYGRLPVLFWSQVFAVAFLVGCTFAPSLGTFATMRCLTAVFGTAPQVTGLYLITDLYPFHLQARKIGIWTFGFLVSPFLSPFAFGFLVARASWRWTYGIGSMYGAIVVVLIALFAEETMFDRTLRPIPRPETTGLRYRIETLIGITGYKMSKYRASWGEAISSPFNVVWRPHILLVLIYEGMLFGFSIGINVTGAVFLGTPAPVGYGFSQFAIAGFYGTPIVSVIIGEIIGRYVNDWIAENRIKKNKGVFESEMRLWMLYLALPIYIAGFVLIGASFQKRLSVAALVFGWGMAEVATMMSTVAVYAYCNNAFPRHQGEISSLINLARTLGGFAVAYYQVPWATKHGALQTFGCEAAVVAGLFILIIPLVQLKGRSMREKYSI